MSTLDMAFALDRECIGTANMVAMDVIMASEGLLQAPVITTRVLACSCDLRALRTTPVVQICHSKIRNSSVELRNQEAILRMEIKALREILLKKLMKP